MTMEGMPPGQIQIRGGVHSWNFTLDFQGPEGTGGSVKRKHLTVYLKFLFMKGYPAKPFLFNSQKLEMLDLAIPWLQREYHCTYRVAECPFIPDNAQGVIALEPCGDREPDDGTVHWRVNDAGMLQHLVGPFGQMVWEDQELESVEETKGEEPSQPRDTGGFPKGPFDGGGIRSYLTTLSRLVDVFTGI